MAQILAPRINGQGVQNWADASAGPNDRNLRTETSEVVENGKRYKVVTSYKVVTRQVPRAVAERKQWRKFGASANDGPGPHVSTTFAAEEVKLQWTQQQAESELADDKKDELRGNTGSAAHCRLCKSDTHWSHNCPYKAQDDKAADSVRMPNSAPGAYVPPGARGGERVGLDRRNDENTCRVTNLPEDMPNLEEELREMFGRVGRIERFYLARDKNTNRLRGFAFITYESRIHTEHAIETFNNCRFGHLILKVEWTKPSNN